MKPLLLLLGAVVCYAQNGYVTNAVDPAATPTNVVTPGMLATLSASQILFSPFVLYVPSGVIGNIFIRPAGWPSPAAVNVISTQNGSATFMVPNAIPFGTAQVYWQLNGGTYRSFDIAVVQSDFALARAGFLGQPLSSYNPISPIKPGQTLLLAGTGLGVGTPVSATIGGLPAPVIFSGQNFLRPGYDEIRLQVPAVSDGCYVPLSLTTGTATVSSTVSVTADGAPCRDPFQLSAADLTTLNGGGPIAVGTVSINSDLQVVLSSAASRQESATFSVSEYSASTLAGYLAPSQMAGCTVIQPSTVTGWIGISGFLLASFPASSPFPNPPDPGPFVTLQNGSTSIRLTGPGYYAGGVPTPQEGSIGNLPATAFPAGQWTWSSPGSKDLAASTFNFTLPAPVQITGGAPLSLRRDRDQTIAWSAVGYDGLSRVNLYLSGRDSGGVNPRAVSCYASAAAGSITIPSAMLSGFGPASIGNVSLRVTPAFPSIPHAVLKTTSGATLLMLAQYASSDSRPVDFQ